jgi:hypothetical protein
MGPDPIAPPIPMMIPTVMGVRLCLTIIARTSPVDAPSAMRTPNSCSRCAIARDDAPAFPERRIRSDRRRDHALFHQSRERGLQPSLTRTHYSAGRVSALLNMPPQTLSVGQKRHLDAFMRFCPGAHKLRRFVLQFRAMLRWRSAKRLNTWID